jgi:hypothetical protein
MKTPKETVGTSIVMSKMDFQETGNISGFIGLLRVSATEFIFSGFVDMSAAWAAVRRTDSCREHACVRLGKNAAKKS